MTLMFDPTPRTRREILIAREAAAKMRCAVQHEADDSDTGKGADWQRHTHPCFACRQRAAEVYQLPEEARV